MPENRRPFPKLHALPAALPLEGAVRIELEEGVPVFRASDAVQDRIKGLLVKQRETGLTAEESAEFDRYEEMDDYLGFVNRVTRNLIQSQADEKT
jgi:hypothetical protein